VVRFLKLKNKFLQKLLLLKLMMILIIYFFLNLKIFLLAEVLYPAPSLWGNVSWILFQEGRSSNFS